MKPFFPLLSAFTLCFATAVHADSFHTFQAADVVLGQAGFTTSATGSGRSGFNSPRCAAMDPVTGKVFVVDSFNNRVLRFSSAAAAQNGASAEAVFGQLNFTDVAANQGGAASATTLKTPAAACVDSAGRLWVSDLNNHRVLGYNLAASLAGPAPAANYVLGQPNFTTTTSGTTAAKLAEPSGVSAGPNDVLWVSDRNPNNRVLRYDHVSLKTNPATASADGVLGQPNFTASAGATTAAGLSSPSGVYADRFERLWVTDSSNSRVLRYDAAAGKPNGANADGVLGQSDFTSNTAGSGATSLKYPSNPYLDPSGDLWVSDAGNLRVSRFSAAASLLNNAPPADLLLGQPSFITPVSATTSQQLSSVSNVSAGAGGSLLVSDPNNQRVLRFSPVPSPAVVLKGKKKITTTLKSFTIKGSATNAVTVMVKVGKSRAKPARGQTKWAFKAKLKPGKNKILIYATDIYDEVSPGVNATVRRR